jgi:prenyltransferase beta subunit
MNETQMGQSLLPGKAGLQKKIVRATPNGGILMKAAGLVFLAALIGSTPTLGQGFARLTAEERAKIVTVRVVRSWQAKDGGFPDKPSETPSSLRNTTAALRILKYFGGVLRDRAACVDFVGKCYDRQSGGFGDHPGGQPDVATTAVGIMAVAELKMPVKEYREGVLGYLGKHVKTFEDIRIAAAGVEALGEKPPEAQRWLEQIARLRHADGTYGEEDGVARDTGSAVVAVLRLGGKVEQRENVVSALKMGQRADGGFGQKGTASSDLGTTYRVMRAFAMLKEKPDVERCRAFIGRCRNRDGLYGLAPGKASSIGTTYNAAIILHWLADA